MKKSLLLLTSLFLVVCSLCQHIHPTHWWVGMKEPKLQILIHRDKVASQQFSMQPYTGVRLAKQTRVANPNYLFLDLVIDKSARPGKIAV